MMNDDSWLTMMNGLNVVLEALRPPQELKINTTHTALTRLYLDFVIKTVSNNISTEYV